MKPERKTAFDAPEDDLDASDKQFLKAIKEDGFHTTWILPEEVGPGFAFSTGFTYHHAHPELLIFSLPNEVAHDINWDVWRRLERGEKLPVGEVVRDVLAGDVPVVFLPVRKSLYRDYLGWSLWFYCGDTFDALVMYWPDKQGFLPWDKRCDPELADLQPDLTVGNWGGLGQPTLH